MKKVIAIMAVVLLVMAGCTKDIGTPEDVAEKYLNDLSTDLRELVFYCALNHDNRSLALMINERADSIISGGKIPTMSELSDKYFEDDKVFYHWELEDKSCDSINLYKVFDLTDETDVIMFDTYMSMESYASKKIIRRENAATFLDEENVLLYKLKYKIDPVHEDFKGDIYKVAEVGVIKEPQLGYRVVSFMWD